MEHDRLGRTRALRSLVQKKKYIAWRGHGKDNAPLVSTKVTKTNCYRGGHNTDFQQAMQLAIWWQRCVSPLLRHLRITFKDRRLFELENSFNGQVPIADFLNGGEFNHRIRVGPGPSQRENSAFASRGWNGNCRPSHGVRRRLPFQCEMSIMASMENRSQVETGCPGSGPFRGLRPLWVSILFLLVAAVRCGLG